MTRVFGKLRNKLFCVLWCQYPTLIRKKIIIFLPMRLSEQTPSIIFFELIEFDKQKESIH